MKQREIKFRAWDGKELHQLSEPVSDVEYNGVYMSCSKDLPEKIILMQFTGLLDKNGKEIYEGDVISTHFEKTNQYEAYTEVGVVNITPHRTEIEDKKHGKYNRFYSHSEVIGNVMENPELLT